MGIGSINSLLGVAGGIGCVLRRRKGRRWVLAWAWSMLAVTAISVANTFFALRDFRQGANDVQSASVLINLFDGSWPSAALAIICLIFFKRLEVRQLFAEAT